MAVMSFPDPAGCDLTRCDPWYHAAETIEVPPAAVEFSVVSHDFVISSNDSNMSPMSKIFNEDRSWIYPSRFVAPSAMFAPHPWCDFDPEVSCCDPKRKRASAKQKVLVSFANTSDSELSVVGIAAVAGGVAAGLHGHLAEPQIDSSLMINEAVAAVGCLGFLGRPKTETAMGVDYVEMNGAMQAKRGDFQC